MGGAEAPEEDCQQAEDEDAGEPPGLGLGHLHELPGDGVAGTLGLLQEEVPGLPHPVPVPGEVPGAAGGGEELRQPVS